MRDKNPSRAFFAVTMAGLGVLGLVKRDFAPIWEPVPKSVPAREVLVYLCAFVSLSCGLGLLWRRSAGAASRVLLGYLLAWLLLLRVPCVFSSPTIDMTWSASEVAVIAAAAWALFASLANGKGLRIGHALYGAGLIPFGVAHFTYLQATVVLMPRWLPFHVAWAYATGAAFVAAGVAILLGVWARPAAVLSALEIGGFTAIVWVPIVLKGANAGQWHEFIVSWVLTAAGWVVAESYGVAS